jgi:hypothetical protein
VDEKLRGVAQVALDGVERRGIERADRDRLAVVAHLLGRPAAKALEVRHDVHVLEEIPRGRVVGRRLDQVLDQRGNRDAVALRADVVVRGRAHDAERRAVLDAHARAGALDLDLHVLRQHDVEHRVAAVEDVDSPVQVLRLVGRVELVVAEPVVQRPALRAGDVVLGAPGVLRRQRAARRVGEIPEVEARHVRQAIHLLAPQRRQHASPVRHHALAPSARANAGGRAAAGLLTY